MNGRDERKKLLERTTKRSLKQLSEREKKDLIASAVSEPKWLGVVVIFVAIIILTIGEISALFLLIQYLLWLLAKLILLFRLNK